MYENLIWVTDPPPGWVRNSSNWLVVAADQPATPQLGGTWPSLDLPDANDVSLPENVSIDMWKVAELDIRLIKLLKSCKDSQCWKWQREYLRSLTEST